MNLSNSVNPIAAKIMYLKSRRMLLPVFNLRCVQYVQERQYAARKGKRAAMLAAKMARKLTQVDKPKPTPSYLIRKSPVSTTLQQKRITDENWFETKPIDNIWRTALYRGKRYDFNELILMYRETHHSSILNSLDAFVYATVELDLHLKKKDQYLDSLNGVISYPNEFEMGTVNKVIAICKSAEDQVKATEAGAVYAGSTPLIKKILSGEIPSEDYDYIVCHPDSYKEINVLRGILKRNYPTAHNGLLRLDVDKAVNGFLKGMKYKMDASVIEPDFGWVNVCFGRLNMTVSHLEENYSHCLNSVLKHKPQGTGVPFITKTVLWCEKSVEKFVVPHLQYLSDIEVKSKISTEPKSEAANSEVGK